MAPVVRRIEVVSADTDTHRLTARYHFDYVEGADYTFDVIRLKPSETNPKILEIRFAGQLARTEWPGLSVRLPENTERGELDITVEWNCPTTATLLPESLPLTMMIGDAKPSPRISMTDVRSDVHFVGFGLPDEREFLSASITQLTPYDAPTFLGPRFALRWMEDPQQPASESLTDQEKAWIANVYAELAAGHTVHPSGFAMAWMGNYRSTHLWRSPSILVFDWSWRTEDSQYREAFLAYQLAAFWWGGLVRLGGRQAAVLQTALCLLEMERLDRQAAAVGRVTRNASEVREAIARRVKNADSRFYAPWHGAIYDWVDRIKEWNPDTEQRDAALRRAVVRWAGFEVGDDEFADTLRG